MAANTLAYGFVQYRHLAAERVTTVGVREIYDAVQQSAAEHTRMVNELVASFVMPTDLYKERYYLPGSGTLQPLDEAGNPRPVRESGSYDVAYPIQGGGTAFGLDRVAKNLITVQEANRITLENLKRDADWMKRHILAAVLDNGTWTFTDPLFGALTIQPLANADSVAYLRVGGSSSTDTHYLAQAASIDDSNNPFDDIHDELTEHPGNTGPVIVYVPTNLTTSIEALTAFVEVTDPDILVGIASDRLNATEAMLNEIKGFGDEVLGKVNKCWIVEMKALPDNYMLAHARGAGPVVAMRQHPAPALQGLFTENKGDGSLELTNMIRYAGFGARNRVAALVYRIGDASYATPTGYSTPLPV